MSNFTSTAVAKVLPSSTQDLTSVIIYIFEGFILCFFNFLLFLIIYSCKYLRNQKEYIIFAGNILSDGLFGASYFIAGIRRLYIYLNVGAGKYLNLLNCSGICTFFDCKVYLILAFANN